MITTTIGDDGQPRANCRIAGLVVYLDNYAFIELAKGDPQRRQKFVSILNDGAEILFSVANLAELSGPQGRSLEVVRTFLQEIGPHWFPAEMDVVEIRKREMNGIRGGATCASKSLIKDYFAFRLQQFDRKQIVSFSSDFFTLEAVLDWVAPQRDSIGKGAEQMDQILITKVAELRQKYEENQQWLDTVFPVLQFNPLMPATFALTSLMRGLVLEANSYRLKKGDGLDLSHAVLASSFASVGALDRHWKRRVDRIPKPNSLAPIYCSPQLDALVSDLESALRSMKAGA